MVNSETLTLSLVYLTLISSVFNIIIITNRSIIGWFLFLANKNLPNLSFYPLKAESFFLCNTMANIAALQRREIKRQIQMALWA